MLKPIIDSAGQDISHWFDAKTNDLRSSPISDGRLTESPVSRSARNAPPIASGKAARMVMGLKKLRNSSTRTP